MVIRNKHLIILGWVPIVGISVYLLHLLWKYDPEVLEILGIIVSALLLLIYIVFLCMGTGDAISNKNLDREVTTLFVKKEKKNNEVSP